MEENETSMDTANEEVRTQPSRTTPSGPIMIEAEGLSKYYGDFIAVENLNFSIGEGEVVPFSVPTAPARAQP